MPPHSHKRYLSLASRAAAESESEQEQEQEQESQQESESVDRVRTLVVTRREALVVTRREALTDDWRQLVRTMMMERMTERATTGGHPREIARAAETEAED